MKSEKNKWTLVLERLFAKNICISDFYKKTREHFSEPALKNFVLHHSSRQAQLAYELRLQIKSMGGNSPALETNLSSKEKDTTPIRFFPYKDQERLLDKILEHLMAYRREYQKALAKINDGSCRELLIRHQFILAITIREIKRFQNHSDFRPPNEQLESR